MDAEREWEMERKEKSKGMIPIEECQKASDGVREVRAWTHNAHNTIEESVLSVREGWQER